jgi:Uma2 family endonuclease
MPAIKEREKATLADFQALPEGPPYHELISGQLVEMPSPTPTHQRIVFQLARRMADFAEEHDLGEVFVVPLDTHLTDEDAYQPDVLFISRERAGIVEERIEGAPDLVVEVLSPSTGYYDLTAKRRVYAETGAREYWIVDPMEETVEVLTRTEAGDFESRGALPKDGEAASQVLDGFTTRLADLTS